MGRVLVVVTSSVYFSLRLPKAGFEIMHARPLKPYK